jgi:N-acetylmuramoyl-L-alanine amidase
MKRVAIDIGHANGTGANGNGYQEHTQCAKIAAELKKALESFKLCEIKADIIDFPNLSNTRDRSETVRAVNAGNYDLLVSLHMDANDNKNARGAHVCYNRTYKADGSFVDSSGGKRCAEEIAMRLCPQLPGRANSTQARPDKKLKLSSLEVLRETRPVAVLVECGFVTNEGDAEWVDKHPDKVALSIALGIASFFDYEN